MDEFLLELIFPVEGISVHESILLSIGDKSLEDVKQLEHQRWKYLIGNSCCDTPFNWLSIAGRIGVIWYAVDMKRLNKFVRDRRKYKEPFTVWRARPLIRHRYGYCWWISFGFSTDRDLSLRRIRLPEIHCESYVYRPILRKPIDLVFTIRSRKLQRLADCLFFLPSNMEQADKKNGIVAELSRCIDWFHGSSPEFSSMEAFSYAQRSVN